MPWELKAALLLIEHPAWSYPDLRDTPVAVLAYMDKALGVRQSVKGRNG